MSRIHFIVFALLSSANIQAQGWKPAGARSMSMANSTVALVDVWSFHHNPAGLAFVKNVSAGLSYENRFLLIDIIDCVITYPKSSNINISGGTPRLSIMPFTAFAIGPGPHI